MESSFAVDLKIFEFFVFLTCRTCRGDGVNEANLHREPVVSLCGVSPLLPRLCFHVLFIYEEYLVHDSRSERQLMLWAWMCRTVQ